MAIREELKSFKKERIFEEASRLFYERGYHGTSLEAIADALQVTKPFIYYHYDRKVDLLLELYLRIVNRTLQTLRDSVAAGGSATARLRRFARLFTAVVIRDQMGVAVFFREEASIPPENLVEINQLKSAFDDELSALIAEGVETGEFAISDLRLATLGIGGMISWIYTWYRGDGRLGADAIAEEMSLLALRLVGADPARP